MPTKFALLAALACALPLTPAAADVHSNGIKWNGINLNGLQLNGAKLNTLRWNGWSLNGLQWNGRLLNGVQFNGARADGLSEAGDLPLAVESITLPNGTVIDAR